jgi:hypothetical protein
MPVMPAPPRIGYRVVMRSAVVVVGFGCLVGVLSACSSSPQAGPPKRPNTELIVGEYERHPPDGETALRFRADGSVRLARSKAMLDADPPLATGTWKLDGARLTLTYDKGICNDRPDDRAGIYTVVISKIGIHFTRVEDSCERRSAIDGQTWWRIK